MKNWTMPKHLEKYRGAIGDTGGNSIEALMNDADTTEFNSRVRLHVIFVVEAQLRLLERLHKKGKLC
ncbi:MAG: hypothetical protein JWQ04_646 [Pedosphaera sp.]|nr:hypothetical protein [Pedosphaera sp.]